MTNHPSKRKKKKPGERSAVLLYFTLHEALLSGRSASSRGQLVLFAHGAEAERDVITAWV